MNSQDIEQMILQAVAYERLAAYFRSRFPVKSYSDRSQYAYLEEQIELCKAEAKRLLDLSTKYLKELSDQ